MSFKLLADASLPELARAFPAPFQLTCYQNLDELKQSLPDNRMLLCRSTLNVNAALLLNHHLDWVLTASSGRDHLDEAYLRAQHTDILDAKGSNASAVVDYVLSCLSVLECKHDFHAREIGIIGYGEVGKRLYQRLHALGYTLVTYDPFHPGPNSVDLAAISNCDLVCIHPNLHQDAPFPSFHLIDDVFIKNRAPHQAIIHAARGHIVDEKALLTHHRGLYCTDVYANEPNIHAPLVQHATLCTPHIAGHTVEAKKEAVRQLSLALHRQLGLTPPTFPPHPPPPPPPQLPTWQETVLSLYNPEKETKTLQLSPSPSETFLSLRQAHYRHAFPVS